MSLSTKNQRVNSLLDELIIPDGTIGVEDRASLVGQYAWYSDLSHTGDIVFNLYANRTESPGFYVETARTFSVFSERSRDVTLYIR